jgi:hypothetical protein
MRYIKNILSSTHADDIAALALRDYKGYWMPKTAAPSNIAERFINSFVKEFLTNEKYEGIQYWFSVEGHTRSLISRTHFDSFAERGEIIKPTFTVTTYLTTSDNPTVVLDVDHYGSDELDFDKERYPKSYWAKAIKGNAVIYKGNKLHLIYGTEIIKKRVNLCFSLWNTNPTTHDFENPRSDGDVKLCNYEEILPHRINGDASLEITYRPSVGDGFLNNGCNKKYSFFIKESFSDFEFVETVSEDKKPQIE